MSNINQMLFLRLKFIFLVSFFYCFLNNDKIYSQNFLFNSTIQTGLWRTHFNYNDIKLVHAFDNKIYASASKGLYFLDLEDNSINILSSINGLSDNLVTALYDDGNALIIGYSSGKIDFLSDSDIITLNLNFDNSYFKINSFNIHLNKLYISSNQGVYVVDLNNKKILEHYSKVSYESSISNIISVEILADSIYLVSENIIYFAPLNGKNLLDFNSWNSYEISGTQLLGSYIYMGKINTYSSSLVYDLSGNILDFNIEGLIKKIKVFDGELKLLTENDLYIIKNNNVLSQTSSSNNFTINDFVYFRNDFWIGLENDGLYSLSLKSYFNVYNAPNINFSKIIKNSNLLYGFNNNKNYSILLDDVWKNKNFNDFKNITSISEYNNSLFFGSKTLGLFDQNNNIIIDKTTENSLLKKNINTDSTSVTGLISVLDKLWILNYGTTYPLISYTIFDGWEEYEFDVGSYMYPVDIIFNNSETFWISLDKNFGGGIILFNPYSNEFKKLNMTSNFLPNNSVNAVVIDKNDIVWVGTDDGLIYFPSSSIEVFNNINSYFKPNNENENILQNIKINSIIVDESNKKWIGTNEGIIVLSSEGNKIEYEFNSKNSPLISNKVKNILSFQNGEIFFLTNDGLFSYKSDNSTTQNSYNSFKAFPNPVNLKDHDLITFSGLVKSNRIKITSLSGKEIITLSAIGGGTSWDLNDYLGIRVQRGIYMIFLLSDDQSNKLISKILIK